MEGKKEVPTTKHGEFQCISKIKQDNSFIRRKIIDAKLCFKKMRATQDLLNS